MDFDDLFGPDPTVVDLRAKDRWEAIEELINRLGADGKIRAEDRDKIAECVRKRETSMSTGIGFGIGIPHAVTDLVSDVIVAVGRSKNGLQFDSMDGKLVDLVMFFLVPPNEFQKHMNILANIAKLIHRADFREWLRRRFE